VVLRQCGFIKMVVDFQWLFPASDGVAVPNK
jgi:hypothetical protein